MADLNYRTYDSLLSSVKKSLYLYNDNNLIKDANYIKIARRINTELTIKINQQKEEQIDVENYRAFLPPDCHSITGVVAVVGKEACEELDKHNFNLDILARKNIRIYPLKPTRKSLYKFSKTSFNRFCKSEYQVDVSEGEMSFNFEVGVVVVAYVAELVDEGGNLLVLDHSIVNDYYESAIRAEMLKDLWYNADADTYNKYQNEVERVLPKAQKKAEGIVFFPGYRKLREYSNKINAEYYNKYIKRIV